MNKQQIAQLNSFQNTQLVLENGILIWQANVAFAANVSEFNLVVADIFKYKNMQITDFGGARVYKDAAREVMAEKSIKVRGALQNFAKDAKIPMLYEGVNLKKSKLVHGNQQKSLGFGERIAEAAKKYEAQLAPYKILPADVEDYAKAVDAFLKAIPMCDGVKNGTTVATKELKVLCPKARGIIETQLRNGATQFMNSAPDFYNELLHSFRIDKLPTHFTEFDMIVINKQTNEALSGVKVTAVSKKGEMIQFSSPIGEVDFTQFEPGYWDLLFDLPGYKPVTKKAVKAELGKKLNLGTIELIPVA